MFRYWNEKYAAIPAVARYDTWELVVENPVSTQKDAEVVAAEQFLFCSDNVWQGSETVNALAGMLIDSSVWNFWWD